MMETGADGQSVIGHEPACGNSPGVSYRMLGKQLPGSLVYLFLCAIAASLLILKFALAPFFWIWLTWAIAFAASIFRVKEQWPRAIFFNLMILAILLAASEAYFLEAHKYTKPTYESPLYAPTDDLMGWAPIKGIQAHVIQPHFAGLFHGPPGVIYDVKYTIDKDGLRVGPPWNRQNLAGTLLFFGCSFTFGHGLQDDQTVPYQVGLQSQGRYRTMNFGFEAYGPAQMLAVIESGKVNRVVDTTPLYAFYLALPDHVRRSAGKIWWMDHAPRYVLDETGTPRRMGNFDKKDLADRLGINSKIAGQLNKSATWRSFGRYDPLVNESDFRLFFAIVRRSKKLLEASYPNIQFRVILWPPTFPSEQASYEKLRAGFSAMGIPVDLVEEAVPGFSVDSAKYRFQEDLHPNALADQLLANYILKKIDND